MFRISQMMFDNSQQCQSQNLYTDAHWNSNKTRGQSKASIRLLSINVNGIKSTEKVTDFNQLIDSIKPDVIIGCESKLDDYVLTTETFPVNYNVYRKDRNTFGGGVSLECKTICYRKLDRIWMQPAKPSD